METEDIISSMPDNVVTHILDLLPIQHAVRTCILSRNWRFKWTMLSQLVFDQRFFRYLTRKNRESMLGRIISRILPNIKGAITKFVLYVEDRCYSVLDDADIAHWILFLSGKRVKDLTICKMNGPPLKLSTHLFLCLELKHLKLFYCCLDPPASFHGFPNLLSFESGVLQSDSSNLGEFFTRCPLLEILNMRYPRFFFDENLDKINMMDLLFVGTVKLIDVAKLANLKVLSLLCNSSSILELVGCLPKLHELSLDFDKFKFTECGAKKKFTAFPCLKTLTLLAIDLRNNIMLSCARELIRSFPNMQTLEITTTTDKDDDPTPAICSPKVDFDKMGPLQLRNAKFRYFKGSESEVCLIKYLLSCSPFLKTIVVYPELSLSPAEHKMFSRKLLKLHRASPTAEIDFH